MLKGIYEIDKCINDFLKPFECSARLSTDFGYYESRNLITYALVVPTEFHDEFKHSIDRLEPNYEMDIFLWSLFHELGHHETLHLLTEKERKESEETKRRIDENELEIELYYDTAEELSATRWAVEFVDTHADEIMEFWGKLQPKILKFFSENHLTND